METLIINNNIYKVVVAASKEEQQQGLMNVNWPPPIMVFPYSNSKIRNFWMKNTYCPLDIVYCNNNKIVDIKHGTPLSLKTISSSHPSDLVIEFPFGFCKQNNIQKLMDVNLLLSLKSLAKLYVKTLNSES